MRVISLREAKATLSAVIRDAKAGEPTTITRRGRAAAVVVPVDLAQRVYPVRRGFGDFLMSFPGFSETIERNTEAPRD